MNSTRSQRILSVILKVFFHLLYHRFARFYDVVAWIVSFGRWQDWILAALPYLDGEPILEIGHGPGHLLQALYENHKRAFGLDESWQMNRLAYWRLAEWGRLPDVVNGYAQSLPFPEATFRHVVATFPSEFIFSPNTLSEIYRVLSPEGTLVVLPIALIQGKSWYDRLLQWLNRVSRQAPPDIDDHLLDELSRPFQQASFETTILTPVVRDSQLVLILARKPTQQILQSSPLT